MKVVLDTNVVLGALIKPNGLASLLVRALDRERLVNYTSEDALTELSLKVAILQENERLSPTWKKTLAHFIAASEIVSPLHRFEICRDADDDKWLEIAYEAKADFILTWDRIFWI
ncbi:putative toxin-antitoxin system toxin component, PIN family [Thermococcus sp.]|uniref:putative toxin-antitoxin system toxin component, PIN family n=1 Tax=Thermococcus sp. TaxID=35749 RepID=UPI00260A2527|nr:putative toxin-antitoxin system toxin component, PIN family [Thermococcus sp.]